MFLVSRLEEREKKNKYKQGVNNVPDYSSIRQLIRQFDLVKSQHCLYLPLHSIFLRNASFEFEHWRVIDWKTLIDFNALEMQILHNIIGLIFLKDRTRKRKKYTTKKENNYKFFN